MRKGISSLCGVVHEKMRSDVRNGDVFIFIGQSRKLMKLLHAEDGGMVMYVKRLEAGRFKLPVYDENTQSTEAMMVGIQADFMRGRWNSSVKNAVPISCMEMVDVKAANTSRA